jgi:hypothetical protein
MEVSEEGLGYPLHSTWYGDQPVPHQPTPLQPFSLPYPVHICEFPPTRAPLLFYCTRFKLPCCWQPRHYASPTHRVCPKPPQNDKNDESSPEFHHVAFSVATV